VVAPETLLQALRFYANGEHMMLADKDAWDTVSGEPPNWWCDEAGTATIEDGTIAARALRGEPLNWNSEGEDATPKPIDGERLAAPVSAAQPVAQGLTETDSELLNFIGGEYLTLESFEMPTGAGDADVGWRTIQHHRNSKRIASEVYEDDPREAIRQAMARIARDPYCTRPLHEDALSTAHTAQADEGAGGV
jgi:hypothetical protein